MRISPYIKSFLYSTIAMASIFITAALIILVYFYPGQTSPFNSPVGAHVNVGTAATGYYTSIAIGQDGLPIVSYYNDQPQGNLKVAKCGNPTCNLNNEITVLDSIGNVGQYTSIAIGSDKMPIISYYDVDHTNLKVAKCSNNSCSGDNSIITTYDTSLDVGQYTSSTIGSDGLPVISYYDNTNKDLRVIKCIDLNCSSKTISIVDSQDEVGKFTSIAIGNDNLPIVAYIDEVNHTVKTVKCGNLNCSISNVISTIGSTGTAISNISLVIGDDGLPLIAYPDNDNGGIKVTKCGNNTCSLGNSTVYALNPDISMNPHLPSMKIGKNKLPIMAFYNAAAGSEGLYILVCGNANCSEGNEKFVIDRVGLTTGTQNSLAIGPEGYPVISYYDHLADNLKVAKCGNEQCSAGNTVSVVDDPIGPTVPQSLKQL